jgi:hypothetical protein
MLRAYLSERLPARVFVPFSVCLALAARAGGGSWSAGAVAIDVGTMTVLVALFRIWDDVSDRAHDRATHPDRVLVRATSIAPFRAAVLTLAVGAAGMLGLAYPHPGGLLTFLAVTGGMALWYACRSGRTTVGDHVLLAKYPALVFVLSLARGVDRPALLAGSATVVYLATCLFEVIHDPASPAARNRPLVAIEALLLVLSSTAVVVGAMS